MEIERSQNLNIDSYNNITKLFKEKHLEEMEDLEILMDVFNSINNNIKLSIRYSADEYRFKDVKDNALWIDVKYKMVNTKKHNMRPGTLDHSDYFRVDYRYGKFYECDLVSEMFYNLEFASITYNLDKIKKVFNRIKLLKEIKK